MVFSKKNFERFLLKEKYFDVRLLRMSPSKNSNLEINTTLPAWGNLGI